MPDNLPIFTLREAARRLKAEGFRVYPQKVFNAVEVLNIPTFPMSGNKRAKGLTRAGFKQLRKALEHTKGRAVAS